MLKRVFYCPNARGVIMSKQGFTTRIVHFDRQQPIEHGAVHKPIHTSVAYGYKDARELARVFQGESAGYLYGRQVNPTVAALEAKVAAMEDGIASVCFATGMAAITTTLLALLKRGDHFVSSSFLFGNTNSVFATLATHGLEVAFVDATDVANVERALLPNTRAVFVETIANPRTQVADLARIGDLCRARGIIYIVDNTMTTPYLYQPKSSGASLVVNALTKYIGGHGKALGGSVTDTGLYDWTSFPNINEAYKKAKAPLWGITQIRKKGLRDFGGSLAPEVADLIAMGAETLALRMEHACANASAVARHLAAHPRVARVYYPGLESHPQHALASALFKCPGALLAIELVPSIDCFDFLNRLTLPILSTNLGDTRTLAIPVAHTIYYEMGAERRASMGIADSLIRLSIGIEDVDDLIADFDHALS
jgi:O-acetylhomoserine (thiol)-lyase